MGRYLIVALIAWAVVLGAQLIIFLDPAIEDYVAAPYALAVVIGIFALTLHYGRPKNNRSNR